MAQCASGSVQGWKWMEDRMVVSGRKFPSLGFVYGLFQWKREEIFFTGFLFLVFVSALPLALKFYKSPPPLHIRSDGRNTKLFLTHQIIRFVIRKWKLLRELTGSGYILPIPQTTSNKNPLKKHPLLLYETRWSPSRFSIWHQTSSRPLGAEKTLKMVANWLQEENKKLSARLTSLPDGPLVRKVLVFSGTLLIKSFQYGRRK